MPLIPLPRLRRRTNLCPLPPFTPRDRRKGARRPQEFPLRLRLGSSVFSGQASDLSTGGIGLWFVAQPDDAPGLAEALASHERGAIEVPFSTQRFVARVRIAHCEPSEGGLRLGVAFDNNAEAERLLSRLGMTRDVAVAEA